MLRYLIFLYSCSLFAARSPSVLYTMDDLKVLNKEGYHQEFVDHAFDIRPTQRTQEWQKLLSDSSINLIQKIIERDEMKLAHYDTIERLTLSPSLRNDEMFLLKRRDFIIEFIQACFDQKITPSQSANECRLLGMRAWKSTTNLKKFPEVGLDIGLTLFANDETVDLSPFIGKVLLRPISLMYCRKKSILDAMARQVINLGLSTERDKTIIGFTRDNYSPECIKLLGPHLFELSKAEILTKEKEQIIRWFNLLEPSKKEEKELMMVHYLLQGPEIGPIFNESWKVIAKMGEDSSKRESLLKQIKRLDPLPDKIFKGKDPLKEKTLFDLFYQNFPEYLSHYSETCLKYYQGKGVFPEGNPTMNCRQVLKHFERVYGRHHPKIARFKRIMKL